MRILAQLTIVLAGVVLWAASLSFVLSQEAPLPKRLEVLWNQDLQLLETHKALPPAWEQIKDIEFHGGTEVAKLWLKEIEIPIVVKPNGQFTLEVLLVDWSENGKTGALIQYNLVDHKTGNMVWELGRTLLLKDESSAYFQLRKSLMNWLRH